MTDVMVTYETKIFVNGEEVDKINGGIGIFTPAEFSTLLEMHLRQIKEVGAREDEFTALKEKLAELGALK